jgi:hypothetical protein
LVLSPSQKRELLARQDLFRKLSDRELDDQVRAVSCGVEAREARHKATREPAVPDRRRRAEGADHLRLGDDIVSRSWGREMFGELALLRGGNTQPA